MDCPRCGAGLEIDGASLRCLAGHGRFLPAQALGPSAAKRIGKAPPSFPTVACPVCEKPMHLRHLRRIDIDVCDCGVWLDQGEEKGLKERHPETVWTVAELVVWIASGFGSLG